MPEILLTNLETSIKLDAMASYPEVIAAIQDTWEFMIGEPMSAEVIDEARTASLAKPTTKLWEEKLWFQAYVPSTLEEYPKELYLRDREVHGTADFLIEAEGRTTLPENDAHLTELIKRLGDQILSATEAIFGDEINAAASEVKEILAGEASDTDKVKSIYTKIMPLMDRFLEHRLSFDSGYESLFVDQDQRVINHILKLSPKSIGNSERLLLKPSCLLMSFIAASLLRKCGIEDIMHAGVVTPKDFAYSSELYSMAQETDAIARDHNVPYPDILRERIKRLMKRTSENVNDWGTHACLVFNVGEETVLFDPFQEVSLILDSLSAAAYQDAKTYVKRQDALEVILTLDAEMVHTDRAETMGVGFRYVREKAPSGAQWSRALDYAIMSNDPNPLFELLDDIDGLAEGFDHLLTACHYMTHHFSSFEGNEAQDDEGFNIRIRKYLRGRATEHIKDCLAKQIFGLYEYQDDEIKKRLERCETDEQYRLRRVEDLQLWPHRIMIAGMQNAWESTANYNSTYPHISLELGNLEHRVGTTALLDVSYGLGYELPISFWARQTSSQLPWLYSEQSECGERESQVGKLVMQQLREVLEVDSWRYRQVADIIYRPERKKVE